MLIGLSVLEYYSDNTNIKEPVLVKEIEYLYYLLYPINIVNDLIYYKVIEIVDLDRIGDTFVCNLEGYDTLKDPVVKSYYIFNERYLDFTEDFQDFSVSLPSKISFKTLKKTVV